jgi:hydrogenase maturation protease
VGVQPRDIEDFGGSLHPLIRSRIDAAVDAALAWLEPLGVTARRRPTPLASSESLGGSEIDLERYEHERPDAATACRVGDDRVLGSERYRVAYRPQALEPGAVSVGVDPRAKN